ncbi:MAG: hypothetical protein LAT75_11890 [Candidatus Cyclonatronum sp.]|uniref:type IV toxin-antitoxin system AbiEi family antitoxin n=1 Tax=Cyclonatronum sp. TaxID=3024185 RepID=UPI0025C39D00|nr:type IV toxin-antitoxin system AbiEi family antitoxin [Cyclonatronum sp.]MCH8487560.1 hypothetical protein [Cyclonatronum sp.]
MKTEMLEKALTHIASEIDLKAEFTGRTNTGPEGAGTQLIFGLDGKEIVRRAEVRSEVRAHQLQQLNELQQTEGPIILVAARLSPAIKKMLSDSGIDWLEESGNIRLKDGDKLIWIDRKGPPKASGNPAKNRAFTKTGLKVVFLFLYDESWLNRTYRDIAEAAGVALGTIKQVLDGLRMHGYLLQINKKNIRLKNRSKLLDQWISAYTDELKPKIITGNYSFINRETELNWKSLPLGSDTVWGGEPAADLIIQNLKPVTFILYSKAVRSELIKKLKLVPNPKGIVELRVPYWTVESENPATAPLLAVYTDLMESGDPRNIESAGRLYA